MLTDKAFILHKRAFKESSELIKLLTKSHGVIDVIAKGSRKPKSRLHGQLQPFMLTEVVFVGRSELKTLTHASQQGLLQNCAYKNHVSMLYLSELMTLIQVDCDVCSKLFDDYEKTVAQLPLAGSVSLLLRKFEWSLCKHLGYELNLPVESTQSDFISFDPFLGLQVNNKDKVCSTATLRSFISNEKLLSSEIKQINILMKTVVNHLVHGKTIQSRQLL